MLVDKNAKISKDCCYCGANSEQKKSSELKILININDFSISNKHLSQFTTWRHLFQVLFFIVFQIKLKFWKIKHLLFLAHRCLKALIESLLKKTILFTNTNTQKKRNESNFCCKCFFLSAFSMEYKPSF